MILLSERMLSPEHTNRCSSLQMAMITIINRTFGPAIQPAMKLDGLMLAVGTLLRGTMRALLRWTAGLYDE